MTAGGKEKINGETITGMALILMALLFIWAGTMNSTWATIYLVDYIILAIGIGFLALGIITIQRTNRARLSHSEGHSSSRY
jgi:type IV secretory pathway VirB3-like protein